ncbi:hypothetical protein [Ramlibacter tataouinensis]|uniref:Uncharacterized protein n=1 Tax=Ramlibacter tataouinensis (strain ATCC BAA-407 / DSM 14655 / LMG 21543 / TTB310) TaxID=365046 RepID=F5Y1C1_RAMTT|nr:hypothetical protein [Ramlibacter tataouinensis]AEG94705.1 Hypothetical protein Rta_35900 [Ramlibacter tataouinensis TTB310]
MPEKNFPLPSDRPQSETLPAQGETQEAVPRMPHERDESAGSTQPRAEPSAERVGRIAQQDAERGVADTSKGAELDATYDRLREDLPDGEKKHRP